MKHVVWKNHLGGQLLYRSLDHVKNGVTVAFSNGTCRIFSVSEPYVDLKTEFSISDNHCPWALTVSENYLLSTDTGGTISLFDSMKNWSPVCVQKIEEGGLNAIAVRRRIQDRVGNRHVFSKNSGFAQDLIFWRKFRF